jgi:hypothetical protein
LKWSKLQAGYGIVHRSVLQMRDLSQGAKLVYALLCSYANKDGECFPSEPTMANDLLTSPSSIKRWKSELLRKGMIGCRLSNTMPAHNIYHVLYPVDDAVRSPVVPLVRSPVVHVRGHRWSPKNTIQEYQGGEPPAPLGGAAPPLEKESRSSRSPSDVHAVKEIAADFLSRYKESLKE